MAYKLFLDTNVFLDVFLERTEDWPEAEAVLQLAAQNKIDVLINKSISFAFQNPEKVMNYVRTHSQEMDEKVMQQHIELYVNEFSLALGNEGKSAIGLLLKKGNAAKLLPEISEQIFVS